MGDLAQAAGDTTQARDYYTQALAIARPLGRLSAIIVDPAAERLALHTTANDPSWVDVLHTNLAALLAPVTPDQALVAHSSNNTPRTQSPDAGILQIFALGPMQVHVGGRQLAASDWVYRQAKEVLLYLLLHPSATREQIALEFWPDASPEQVRSRFSAVLSFARKALGRDFDWIPFADGRYRFNRTGIYWVDVEAFEAKLNAAYKHLRHTPPQKAEALGCLESALTLYQGDLAADFRDEQWLENKREALRQAFAHALLTLGRLYGDAGRPAEAAAIYRRALTHDCYLEEAHRELMRCLARQGEQGLALQQYESLVRVLQELGAPPSSETQRLVARLRRGEEV